MTGRLLLLLALAAGCGEPGATSDGAVDLGGADASTVDGGGADGGTMDASSSDAFIADGGPFVSQADKNPTWTILALAWRQSEYIIEQMKQRNL